MGRAIHAPEMWVSEILLDAVIAPGSRELGHRHRSSER